MKSIGFANLRADPAVQFISYNQKGGEDTADLDQAHSESSSMYNRFLGSAEFEIVVIGAGPAGLAAGSALTEAGFDFAIFEAGPELNSRTPIDARSLIRGVGGAGLYSDGKFSFYPSATSLWSLHDEASLRTAYEWLINLFPKDYSKKHLAQVQNWPTQVLNEGVPTENRDFKEYPSIKVPLRMREEIVGNLSDKIAQRLRIHSRVVNIRQQDNSFRLSVENNLGLINIDCKIIVFAGGRFGPLILQRMFPEVSMKFKRVEVGIRIEQPAKDFVFRLHPSRDVKKIQQTADEEWRTFCTCRNGEVVETNWDGLISFSGRSDGPKTRNSNMGLNIRYYNRPENEIVAKEIFSIIHGEVKPFSLNFPNYQNAQEPFMGRILDKKFQAKIQELVHEDDLIKTRVHGPTIEGVGFYPDINSNLKVNSQNMWIAGDSTGIFRGLTAALISGYYCGLQIINHLKKTELPHFIKQSPVHPMPVIFTAQSKVSFYCRDVICEFVLKRGALPLNPFRVFDYFLGDRVNRDSVRQGNNQLISISNELWVFGPVADGVLFEIVRARQLHKPVRYFTIGTRIEDIREITNFDDVKFEPEVHKRQIKRADLHALIWDEIMPSMQHNEDQLEIVF